MSYAHRNGSLGAIHRVRRRRRGLIGVGALGDGDGKDVHGCTPEQVWNDTAGACVSLDENITIINKGVAAATSSSSSSGGFFDTLLGGMLKGVGTAQAAGAAQGAAQAAAMQQAQTTKLLLLGGLGLGALIILMKD